MSTFAGGPGAWPQQRSSDVGSASDAAEALIPGPSLIRLRDHSGSSAPSIYSRKHRGGSTTVGTASTSGAASCVGGSGDSDNDEGCQREQGILRYGSQRSGSATADVAEPHLAAASGGESARDAGGACESNDDELSAGASLFSVKFFQDNQECLLLPIQGRQNLILLFEQGYFSIRLESFYSGLAIAKLEIDGCCTKCNFRLLPGKAHTVRETRIAVGQHAIPLTFDPTEQQMLPVRCSEDVDRAVGSLRILFFHAHEEAGTLKWQWDAQDPLEVVSLDYGSLATFVRAFPAVEMALAERSRGVRTTTSSGKRMNHSRRVETYYGDDVDERRNDKPAYRTVTAPSRIAEAYERHIQRSQRRIAADAELRRGSATTVKRRGETITTSRNAVVAAVVPPPSLRDRGDFETTGDRQQQVKPLATTAPPLAHRRGDDELRSSYGFYDGEGAPRAVAPQRLGRPSSATQKEPDRDTRGCGRDDEHRGAVNPLLVLDAAARNHRSASASSRNSTSPSAHGIAPADVVQAVREQTFGRDLREATSVNAAAQTSLGPTPQPCQACKALFDAQEARHQETVHRLIREIQKVGGKFSSRTLWDSEEEKKKHNVDVTRNTSRSSGSRSGASRSPSPHGEPGRDVPGLLTQRVASSGSRRESEASSHAKGLSGNDVDLACGVRYQSQWASHPRRCGPVSGSSSFPTGGATAVTAAAPRLRDTGGDHVLRLAEEIVAAERTRRVGASGGAGGDIIGSALGSTFSADAAQLQAKHRRGSGEVLADHRANVQHPPWHGVPSKYPTSGVSNLWSAGSVVPPDPFVVRSC